MKKILAKIVECFCQMCLIIYQNWISPHMAPSCRYYPSCSSYAKEVINNFGIKGLFIVIKRLLKCNPIFPGGYDPAPKKNLKDNNLY